MANQVLPKTEETHYRSNENYDGPAPEYSPPRNGAVAAYDQPAPPYSGPSVSYFNPSAPYDYSQYNPYTINQPDPSFYSMPPCGPLNSSSTTVVIQQPVPALGLNGRRDWSTGMCNCCKDMNICNFTFVE